MATIGTYRQISEKEFKGAVKDSRISDKNRELAHRVLVRGEKPREVADAEGLNRQTVYALVRRVYAEVLVQNSYPKEWVTAEVTAPKKELEAFLKKIERLRIRFLP